MSANGLARTLPSATDLPVVVARLLRDARRLGSGRLAAWLVFPTAALLAGCAAPLQIAQLSPDSLKDRTLAVRTGSTPSFYADTPGRRTFGLLGVVGMMREGNQLVEQYGLQDPAGVVSDELAATLTEGNRMRTASAEDADLVLDVKTINWDFRPYRSKADALFVVYSARVSLIDQREGTVLATGKCRSRLDPATETMSRDDLLADGARRLHEGLRQAGLECVQALKASTLNAYLGNILPPVAQQSAAVLPR